MALELLITFKDQNRQRVFHPFSLQEVLRRAWWPLAKRLGLPMIEQLECLDIRDRAAAENLVRELETVRNALAKPEAACISQGDAAYMLKRISEVEPLIRTAIKDWDSVDSLSL